jgi:hypothetical protein
MNLFEDTIQFDIKKKVGDVEITYSDLMEISQGGPVVGSLSINGKLVVGRYGGPAICKDKYVYVPVHVKKFFGTGFKLARINAATLEVEHMSKTKDLIYLDKIEGNRIIYFEDMSKTIQGHYEI